MTDLRCGTHGISIAELGLLKTLFRLYGHGKTAFRWELVDAPPFDAILVDENAAATLPASEWSNVRAILTLGSANAEAGANTMARPLRSEKLQAWLMQAEQEFFAVPGELQSLPAQPEAAEPAPVASTTTAQAPVEAPLAEPAAPAAAEGTTFKLLRWPPSAMLRTDPRLIRMATVLSRRAMKISELAQVSQQPMDEAYVFVQALRSAGMLDIRQGTAPLPATTRLSVAVHRSEKPGRKIERSLVSRIRQRLGL